MPSGNQDCALCAVLLFRRESAPEKHTKINYDSSEEEVSLVSRSFLRFMISRTSNSLCAIGAQRRP